MMLTGAGTGVDLRMLVELLPHIEAAILASDQEGGGDGD